MMDEFAQEILNTANSINKVYQKGLNQREQSTNKNELPWSEKVPLISINPDVATKADIANMAAELCEIHKINKKLETERDYALQENIRFSEGITDDVIEDLKVELLCCKTANSEVLENLHKTEENYKTDVEKYEQKIKELEAVMCERCECRLNHEQPCHCCNDE